MNSREKQLMGEVPLMKCANRLEFQQRLQWLSEGMLRHHIEGKGGWPPDQDEIEKYRRFRNIAKD